MRDVLEIVLVVVLEARAMLQKNMCHLRMAVAGKSTADRSPKKQSYNSKYVELTFLRWVELKMVF